MLIMVKSDPHTKRETHLSRIYRVNDMRHVLLLPDGLAAQIHDEILCVDPQ